MSAEGGSAGQKARSLRAQAAEARAKAERLELMAQNWEAGEAGEQLVARALKPIEGPHCYVYHDRLLRPGRSKVNLDHVVISEGGNYLIDAKNWTGDIRVVNGSIRRELDGRSSTRDRELDKVRTMAQEMQLVSPLIIEPVVCLTGERASSFGPPQYVRGVHVVRVDQLASWLLGRPRPASNADLRTQAVSMAATFPSATEPAFLSIPSPRPSTGPRPARPRSKQTASRRQTPRRSANAQGLGTALLLFVIALVLSSTDFGHQLIRDGVNAYAKSSTPKPLPQSQLNAWVHPCSKLTDAEVTKAVGVRVYRYVNGTSDLCTWGLRPRSDSSQPPMLLIETGWSAKGQTISGRAAYTQTADSIGLTVPQFSAVPGSKLAAKATTQPIYVGLDYAGTSVGAAKARQIVTALAAATARHLPTGPGATEIRVR